MGGKLIDRRSFVAGGIGACALAALGGAVALCPKAHAVLPPGAQDEEVFLGACLRCQKCIEVCPNGALVPSRIEDGVAFMRTPKLDFSQSSLILGGRLGWCDHCLGEKGGVARCAKVCPTGALDAARSGSFESMRLGVAVVDRETCLAWNLKGCAVCQTSCPMGALSFDEHGRPNVDAALCNGCGACEQACVSLESNSVGEGATSRQTTRRAIYVMAGDE